MKIRHMSFIGAMSMALVMPWSQVFGVTIDFEVLSLTSNSSFNGGPATNTDGWTSGNTSFGNSFTDWGGGFTSWNGFSYSNVNDVTTPGFGNEYAAFTGTAYSGTIYAVGYSGSQDFINLPTGLGADSVRVTNTTYAALDMTNGSGFSKKFGGPSGNDPDFLSVTFTGYSLANATGSQVGTPVEFYLADFRFADNSQDYIVDSWQLLDLSPLGHAASIGLSWGSSDVGIFGINTPTYVAIDDLTIAPVPEPGTWALGAVAIAGAVGLRWRRRQVG